MHVQCIHLFSIQCKYPERNLAIFSYALIDDLLRAAGTNLKRPRVMYKPEADHIDHTMSTPRLQRLGMSTYRTFLEHTTYSWHKPKQQMVSSLSKTLNSDDVDARKSWGREFK